MRPKLFKHYSLIWSGYEGKSYCYYCGINKELVLDKLEENSDIYMKLETTVNPLYKNGRIIEFEDIHLFDKYVPDDRIDSFLKSFPLYISLGNDNSSVKYLRCNLLNNTLLVNDIEKDRFYPQSINFDNDFKRFVNDFVNSFDISEMILKSITVQSLLDNKNYYLD